MNATDQQAVLRMSSGTLDKMKGRAKEAAGALAGDNKERREGTLISLRGGHDDASPGSDKNNQGTLGRLCGAGGDPPPGRRAPFSYRSDSALPQRRNGSLETPVVSLEQVGRCRPALPLS